MTQHHYRATRSSNSSAKSHESSRPSSEPHPFFKGMSAFEAEMLRVATLDLSEEGSGCGPFIAATAELAPEVRRELLLEASGALLDYCDRYGAAECLKHAFGLEHLAPSDELDRAIEAGLQIIAETAEDDDDGDPEDDDDDLDDETERVEEPIRNIEEDHRSPQASPSMTDEALHACMHTSGGSSRKTTYQRIFEFIDAHPGCLTRDVTRHMNRSVAKYLDEMDRANLIVRITKHDRYACADGREKRHYIADQHIGHIARYGVGDSLGIPCV